MTSIQERSAALVIDIFKDQYYPSIFDMYLTKHNMSVADIELYKRIDKQLVNMWQDFWMALPDEPCIRRGPFFMLCDLCESS
jgi:hypothetical protein